MINNDVLIWLTIINDLTVIFKYTMSNLCDELISRFNLFDINHDINPFINLNFPQFERFIILERPNGGDLKLLEWSPWYRDFDVKWYKKGNKLNM